MVLGVTNVNICTCNFITHDFSKRSQPKRETDTLNTTVQSWVFRKVSACGSTSTGGQGKGLEAAGLQEELASLV